MHEGSRSEVVFNEIVEFLNIVPNAFLNPRGMRPRPYREFVAKDREMKNREVKRVLSDLKNQQLIKIVKKGENIFVSLTEDGKIEAIKMFIITKQKKLPQGIVCLVSFDIPESVRHVRDVIRKLLKDAGFRLAHQSVWVSD